MNRRTLFLGGLALVGMIIALVVSFTGGDGVVKPKRMVDGTSSAPAPANAPAGSAGNSAKSGFDGFKLFHTRNVFDPDRRPPRLANETTAPTPSPGRQDFVALTGVMIDQQRSLAFFSGSRAEYNKVLSVKDSIAGAEITQIGPSSIEIARAGQKTNVAVGQTVPFANGTAPAAAPAPDTFAAAPSTSSMAAASSATSPAPTSQTSASSSKQEEIRRRLEERRRQEQK